MVADHWFRQIENMLEAMDITSYVVRIRLAMFQLEGESQVWWDWVKTYRDLEAMTWVEFHELFMGKYFPATARYAKAQEFLEFKQGAMTVIEYLAKFIKLARFTDYVATDMEKVRRFENGLRLSIWGGIVGLRLQDMDSMVGMTMTIKREMEDARSTRDAGASGKRKECDIPSLIRPNWRVRTESGMLRYQLICDTPNPAPGVQRRCHFFFKLIASKFVHSYTVKHLTCIILCSCGLQNIYKLHIWKCSTFKIFTLFTK